MSTKSLYGKLLVSRRPSFFLRIQKILSDKFKNKPLRHPSMQNQGEDFIQTETIGGSSGSEGGLDKEMYEKSGSNTDVPSSNDMPLSNDVSPSNDGKSSEQRDELKKENRFLKEYVTRLSIELKFFHEKTGLKNEGMNSTTMELPDWMTSSNVMSPLFLAYDTKINQLNSIIQNQEKLLNDMKIEANGNIDAAVTDEYSLKVTEGISSFLEENNKDEYLLNYDDAQQRLKSQLRITKEENSLLNEQTSILTNELENAQKHILSQGKQIALMSQGLDKKTKASEKLQHELNSLTVDKMSCEDELFEKVKNLLKEQDNLKKMESDIKSINNLRSHLTAKIEELAMEKEELEIEVEQLTSKVRKQLLIFKKYQLLKFYFN